MFSDIIFKPFNEINDLIRDHNSPPDTIMRDYSTDYLTSSASPQKTNFTPSVPTSTRYSYLMDFSHDY